MATLRDLKKIISKYHNQSKRFHREQVNLMWKDIYKLFKQIETDGDVAQQEQPTQHLKKKHCKYCDKWVNLEEYNIADEICIKCYNENVDEEQETGNE